MNTHFPGLELVPPLFYNGDIGIRFELGVNDESSNCREGSTYLKEVDHRAITLFETLHPQEENLVLVVNIYDYRAFKRNLRLFASFIKSRKVLYQLKHTQIRDVFTEKDEETEHKTHRFILSCKTKDIRYQKLTKAICRQDLGIRPSMKHDVFFIHQKNHTIFHVYDDRGCDVVAASTEAIRPLYENDQSWILDYDRAEIDATFKK
ncbi:DUF3885 domain-containing protein [Priestia koreensis]|uniref:DUF3885 domain-containing protein n=1 Tax=Priestia koreensis TaxID=284581 RepID=UPI00345AEF6C